MNKDIIIIGGGAAGLFCAFTAARRGRSVLVLERADKVGKKILISGGGRCNFTNLYTAPENYLCRNPNFHKSALARYTPQDFIELVERHGIRYHEKKLGQLFCDSNAQDIVKLLLRECERAGVEVLTSCQVDAVDKQYDRFVVKTSKGRYDGGALIIATGGLSIPQMGATDFGYRVAKQFGLKLVQTRPALVPFTLGEHDRQVFSPLSGVSVEAVVSLAEQSFRENILVTHQGLSGPAILQISSYWQHGAPIHINLLPDGDAHDWLTAERGSQKELKTLLSQHWPQRFAQAWTQLNAPLVKDAKPLRQYANKELDAVAERLQRWQLTPNGTEGYRKAEVTAGGVDTDELSSRTMEARQVSGLFFIGEVVDVTGWLGGYNFQWAWASGHAAGEAV
jgi:predicted Rossmann fold flavoprotein